MTTAAWTPHFFLFQILWHFQRFQDLFRLCFNSALLHVSDTNMTYRCQYTLMFCFRYITLSTQCLRSPLLCHVFFVKPRSLWNRFTYFCPNDSRFLETNISSRCLIRTRTRASLFPTLRRSMEPTRYRD